MGRGRAEEGTPDRLAAVLEELEAVRRAPGWVPTEDSVVDEPRSRVADLPRRVAATRRAEHSDQTRRGRHSAGGGNDELRPREPLLRPPEPLIGAQVAPSRLAVIGALILVSVAALVFGGRVLWARAAAEPHPVASAGAATSTSSASASAPSSSATRQGFGSTAASSSAAPTTLVVQVVGQVRKPGVVHVKSGSRVQDAVSAAGGALPGADLSAINLARVVADGEQIQVPKPGEHPTPPAAGGAAGGSSAAGGAGGGSPASTVNLNTADETTLEGLPGVGPVMAQRILQWRADNGRFSTVDELGEVSGIGDKTLAQLLPLVTVG
ncbi:helix-hairpin-helix domain-containing protein [Flexivirga alba]|uniref:Helix-hairpin-helix domain-containing protein n=1 Tax=Flexivirga alba TaxID=702742 RepID=A0ABW2AHC5_9MICO